MAKEIAEEYTSSLADLTLNSKPLINMLTMLADDNIEHAQVIVEAVEKHLEKVRSEFKLPVLYLIDSIVKNVGRAYTNLFTNNIVNTFCAVFEKVDEKVRAQMFKLRQTWSDVFPSKKLYTLDVRVQCIDPAWPITAPQPTPNIHVNPKFFAMPPNAKSTPSVVAPKVPALDPATLDMQTQLINKQKELLELKQKKLELELLQAKAKLEEQQKQLERQSVVQIKTPQQLLLKPEVAKQLAQTVPLSGIKVEESPAPIKRTNQSIGAVRGGVGGVGRIAPVSSALVASVGASVGVRAAAAAAGAGAVAVRDPRLLRQQTAAQLNHNHTHNTSSNVYEPVNLDDKNKVKTKSITITNSINKVSAQGSTLNRKDPRLISNKVQGPTASNKTKSNNGRASSNERSPNKTKTTSPIQSRKSNKASSRNFKNSVADNSSATVDTNTSSKSATRDSSNKSNSDSVVIKTTPSSSPVKYRKKQPDHSSPRTDKSASETQKRSKNSSKSDKSSRSRERTADKYDDDNGSPSSNVATPGAFKELKGATKNRNYMRRNRAISISPEPNQDVDLRVIGPPEKQARLQPSTPETPEVTPKNPVVDDSPSNKDVDLRTLVVPALISKKRSSTEKLEHTNVKKSKSQMFDVLFGNEDVDLRQLPPVSVAPVSTQAAVARPPTPPPPIISTPPSNKPTTTDSRIKSSETKSSLDVIRAKLANAAKVVHTSDEKRINLSEDTDMRLKSSLFSSGAAAAEEMLQKIIISQDDEQHIRNGNLSQALVEKVLTLFETQKLQEAQRRDSEETKNHDFNVTLTPISDDELSVDFSHSESEDDSKKKTDAPAKFGDTDERVAPPAPVISQNAMETIPATEKPELNVSHMNVDPRLPMSRITQMNAEHSWHGHHRRRRPKTHWDSPPPEAWIRPPPAVHNPGMYAQRRPFPAFIRPPADNFAPKMDTPLPMVPPPHLLEARTGSPPTIGSQTTKELPLADPLVLEYIDQDTMRTINIDGRPREIRYYDETAVVIMSWDDPREISFQNGTRIVTFDEKESFSLSFNDVYRDVTIGGNPHRIRLGAPTRELYIDGKWYECFFGGPGIGIEIDGKMRVVKMDGPPPHVKIGTVKRIDLVAGKINLIINARSMVPVFLDAKPQKFDIEGKVHTLRFVDALRTVLINEVPFKVEFGGLPKPITVHDKKHFIRFSVLPRGIKPGYVNIANMEGQRFPDAPEIENTNSNDATNIEAGSMSVNEPALPMLGKRRIRTIDRDSPDSSRNSPTSQNQPLGTLDVLSSIMTSPMANSTNVSGYQVELRDQNSQDSQDGFPVSINRPNEIPGLSSEPAANAAPLQFLPASLNINELFQKLVATGIVTSAKEKTPPPQKFTEDIIRPVLFSQPETLKTRQLPLIQGLYAGMQCSSCGVRFPPEHSMQYSQHLDWHFRQNRRGRNSARKALCRKWYYEVSDWKNYEEIEDIEEREKNWFESQQQQQQSEGAGEDGEEEVEIPSVPADSNSQDTCCEVCRDRFEQFYNEEKEEWHLRMAIRVDDKTYHPLCYDDYKTSLVETTIDESLHNNTLADANMKEDTELLNKNEVKPEENETPLEEVEMKTENAEIEKSEEPEDDDVVIEEPKIEQIIIDDKDTDETQVKAESDEDEHIKNVVIKQEPLDDEMDCINIKQEPIDTEADDVSSQRAPDTTHAELVSSIDGNVQMTVGVPMSAAPGIAAKIKINITKPILAPKEPKEPAPPAEPEPPTEPIVDYSEPLPPGEEPVQLNLKPALQGLSLVKQPPVMKGTELTGLCSIM